MRLIAEVERGLQNLPLEGFDMVKDNFDEQAKELYFSKDSEKWDKSHPPVGEPYTVQFGDDGMVLRRIGDPRVAVITPMDDQPYIEGVYDGDVGCATNSSAWSLFHEAFVKENAEHGFKRLTFDEVANQLRGQIVFGSLVGLGLGALALWAIF